MKRLLLCSTVMLTGATWAAGQAPEVVGLDPALGKLQGTWLVASREENVEMLDERPKRVTVTIDGNRMTVRSPGKIHYVATLKVTHTTQKGIAHMNLRIVDGENEGTFWHHIVYIEGDTFHNCFSNTPGGPRPTAFASDPTADTTYVTWERVRR